MESFSESRRADRSAPILSRKIVGCWSTRYVAFLPLHAAKTPYPECPLTPKLVISDPCYCELLMSETTVRLASFLDTAEADLADILERRELLAPLVLTLALSIWPTIRERFQRLRRQLIEAPPEVDERLLAVGLAGR